MRDRILEEIKPADILPHYGIESIRGKYLCPFHSDSHPSMSAKGDLIRCWVCMDKAINVIDFVMQHENISFKSALNVLCEIGNICPEKQEFKRSSINYKVEIENLEKRINFCKNSIYFADNKEVVIRDLKKAELKKENILLELENDGDFLDREFERVRTQSADRNNRKCVEMLRKRD